MCDCSRRNNTPSPRGRLNVMFIFLFVVVCSSVVFWNTRKAPKSIFQGIFNSFAYGPLLRETDINQGIIDTS